MRSGSKEERAQGGPGGLRLGRPGSGGAQGPHLKHSWIQSRVMLALVSWKSLLALSMPWNTWGRGMFVGWREEGEARQKLPRRQHSRVGVIWGGLVGLFFFLSFFFFFFLVFFWFFFRAAPMACGSPQTGQLQAYTTATATPDPSPLCNYSTACGNAGSLTH